MSASFEIEVELVATETCTIILTENDLDEIRDAGLEVTRQTIRNKAVEIFEMPDFSDRSGVDYHVSFDFDDAPSDPERAT